MKNKNVIVLCLFFLLGCEKNIITEEEMIDPTFMQLPWIYLQEELYGPWIIRESRLDEEIINKFPCQKDDTLHFRQNLLIWDNGQNLCGPEQKQIIFYLKIINDTIFFNNRPYKLLFINQTTMIIEHFGIIETYNRL